MRKILGETVRRGQYFPTHGETNKFVYWMENRIQFYHYYVLRILRPISLYTFLNKFQIKEKKILTNYGIQNYFQFKLPNHGKEICVGIDTFSMQWNQKNTGNHIEEEGTI